MFFVAYNVLVRRGRREMDWAHGKERAFFVSRWIPGALTSRLLGMGIFFV